MLRYVALIVLDFFLKELVGIWLNKVAQQMMHATGSMQMIV